MNNGFDANPDKKNLILLLKILLIIGLFLLAILGVLGKHIFGNGIVAMLCIIALMIPIKLALDKLKGKTKNNNN
ncbi:MAG TPA: hypothetical protein VK796_08335 [Cytophaga sp.]|jgi:hypothetical protein|nr:hypothetical protein [Cytophaga sp.]